MFNIDNKTRKKQRSLKQQNQQSPVNLLKNNKKKRFCFKSQGPVRSQSKNKTRVKRCPAIKEVSGWDEANGGWFQMDFRYQQTHTKKNKHPLIKKKKKHPLCLNHQIIHSQRLKHLQPECPSKHHGQPPRAAANGTRSPGRAFGEAPPVSDGHTWDD